MSQNPYIVRTLTNPKSVVSESYRILRTNIQFASIDSVIKTILFTSTIVNEGKSSIVANLAGSLVQSGKNVLVVDADLRKPTQHKIFGLDNSCGLLNTLIEDVPSLQYVRKTELEGLEVLTTGYIPPNPSELLATRRMKVFLSKVALSYDMVLIDSPPIVAVTDATILAQIVDGVVLVLSSGELTRESAIYAKERLDKVGARIIGTVLNKVVIRSQDYPYYYYGPQYDSQ